LGLKIDNFIPQLFIEKDGRLEALAMKVKGKRDSSWKYFWIWADHDCPDLCPVRHLLVYLYLTGHQGGYLFPTVAEIKEKPADGIFMTAESYQHFRRWYRTLVDEVLSMRTNAFKIGLHMFRKAGYLFRLWAIRDWKRGDLAWASLKKDARHEKDEDAEKYAKDAAGLRHIANLFNDPANRVVDCRPIYLEAPELATYLSHESTAKNVALPELAKKFVKGLGSSTDQVDILNKACAYGNHRTSTDIANDIRATMSNQQAIMFDAFVRATQMENAVNNQQSSSGRLLKRPVADEPMAEPRSQLKRRKASGDNDLAGRKEVANMPTVAEKVAKLQEIASTFESTTELTGGAKKWVTVTLRPVLGCLQHHFRGDVEAFASQWQRSFKMKFGDCCCKGQAATHCGKFVGKKG